MEASFDGALWVATSARRALSAFGLLVLAMVQTAQAQAPSVLDRVQSSRELRVCTTGDYIPFSYRRPDGAFEGMDIDLAKRLAQALGARIEWVQTSWTSLMADFNANKCDIAMGGISVSLERQKHAAFSSPYLVDGKSAIARCTDSEKFGSLAAIDRPGVRVVVNPGGTNERFATSRLTAALVRVYPDNVTIFDEIVNDRADVMITDTSETLAQHKLHPELCAIHPEAPFQYGEKAYLMPRDDVAFKDYVDQWLHLAERTGELGRIKDQWLQ